MISRDADRRYTFLVALCVAVAFAACGGGGNGTSNGTTGGNTATPGGNPTSKTRTSTPTQHTTQGLQATPTPLPTGAPNSPIIVPNGGNIVRAVRNAPPGSTVYIAPGIYPPFTLGASDVQGPIILVADVTGTISESSAGAVIIDAGRGDNGPAAAAIALSGIPEGSAVVIDSFTLRGGTGAGITVDGSPGTIIENCTFESNPGDGVRFTASNGSLLFNNLLFNNSGAGVHALGTDGLWVFNNTIYNNTGTGIAIGSDQDASPDAVVENNIINSNGSFGIAVTANSTGSYHGDYNLNSDGYAAGTPPGPDDITADLSAMSLFISPTADPPDLHLAPSSLAVGAGDPATLADLGSLLQNQVGVLSSLQSGTTQTDGTLDCQFADLGYHYRVDQTCGVPTPTPTSAPTKTKKKATATPTP